MKLGLFPVALPAPGDPFIDPKTGILALLTGRKMIEAVWNRTGAGDGVIPSIATGLIAKGTTQLTALALTDDWNEVDTVAPGTGVQIPQLQPGQLIAVFNGGANALNIYPPGGNSIDGAAVNAAYSLGTVRRLQIFWQWTLTALRSYGNLQIP